VDDEARIESRVSLSVLDLLVASLAEDEQWVDDGGYVLLILATDLLAVVIKVVAIQTYKLRRVIFLNLRRFCCIIHLLLFGDDRNGTILARIVALNSGCAVDSRVILFLLGVAQINQVFFLISTVELHKIELAWMMLGSSQLYR